MAVEKEKVEDLKSEWLTDREEADKLQLKLRSTLDSVNFEMKSTEALAEEIKNLSNSTTELKIQSRSSNYGL